MSETTLQRLIALECQKTKQNRHIKTSQKEKCYERDQRACDHGDPQRLAYAIHGISLEQYIAGHIASVEWIDRKKIDHAPKDIDPKQSGHKHIQQIAAKGKYCEPGQGDKAEQPRSNDRSTQ